MVERIIENGEKVNSEEKIFTNYTGEISPNGYRLFRWKRLQRVSREGKLVLTRTANWSFARMEKMWLCGLSETVCRCAVFSISGRADRYRRRKSSAKQRRNGYMERHFLAVFSRTRRKRIARLLQRRRKYRYGVFFGRV
ncbi:MAG: hypothetical protein ACLRTQ_01230 [Candidatus Borkfalkia sp.]